MRVLFFTNVFPSPSEPTRGVFNLRLVEALARAHDVRVVCPVSWTDECRTRWAGRGPAGILALPDVEVYYPRYYFSPKILRGRYGHFMWWSVRGTIRRLLADWRPEAIVSYWAHPDGYVGVKLGRALGVPALVMVGGTDVLLLTRHRRRRDRVAEVLREADAVIAVGSAVRDRVLELGVAPEKTHIVPRGVDQRLFHPGDRTLARRRLGLPAEGRIVLYVGRLEEVKGPDILLETAGELSRRAVPFHLYLVGSGSLRHRLERQAASSAARDALTFVGPVPPEQLGDWYRAADLTVLPSRSEGVPNVLRESIACGTPFVACRVGGVAEVQGGRGCRLVAPNDPVALAGAITESLAEAGRPEVPSASWDDSAAALMKIIDPLVRTAGARLDAASPAASAIAPSRSGRPWRRWARTALAALLPRRWLTLGGDPLGRQVCLTFDDGPHPEHTPRLLDVLREHRVPATFFVVGELAERYPGLVRRMAAEGHLVGNHSFSHSPALRTASAREYMEEVRQTNRVLAALLGREPEMYRPPYGHLTAPVLVRLWQAGLTTVLWNVDPKDYLRHSPEEVREWFRQRPLRGGDLVLLHDRLPYAAEVLPEVIGAARGAGLTFATLPTTRRHPRSSNPPGS